jgi:hypothetical protein
VLLGAVSPSVDRPATDDAGAAPAKPSPPVDRAVAAGGDTPFLSATVVDSPPDDAACDEAAREPGVEAIAVAGPDGKPLGGLTGVCGR